MNFRWLLHLGSSENVKRTIMRTKTDSHRINILHSNTNVLLYPHHFFSRVVYRYIHICFFPHFFFPNKLNISFYNCILLKEAVFWFPATWSSSSGKFSDENIFKHLFWLLVILKYQSGCIIWWFCICWNEMKPNEP